MRWTARLGPGGLDEAGPELEAVRVVVDVGAASVEVGGDEVGPVVDLAHPASTPLKATTISAALIVVRLRLIRSCHSSRSLALRIRRNSPIGSVSARRSRMTPTIP